MLAQKTFWPIIAVCFLAPFQFRQEIWDYVNLPQQAFIQVSVLGLLIVLLAWKLWKEDFSMVRCPLNLPLTLFLAWTGASTYWGVNGYEAWLIYGHWLACGVMFWVILNSGERKYGVEK